MGKVVCTLPRYYDTVLDLDEVTQSGCYYVINASTNKPTTQGGMLFVGGGSSSVAGQLFVTNRGTPTVYARLRNASGWGEWKSVTLS